MQTRASAGRGVGGQPPGRTGGNQPPAGPSDALPKALKAPGSCLRFPLLPSSGHTSQQHFRDNSQQERTLLRVASNCSVPGYRSWREPLKAFRFSTKGGPGRLSPGRDFPHRRHISQKQGTKKGGVWRSCHPL